MNHSLHSMTGFGTAVSEDNALRVRVDVRTVNHRSLRMSVRCRGPLGAVEKRVRDALAAFVHRGQADITITICRLGFSPDAIVNGPLAKSAVDALRTAARDLDLDGGLTVSDLLQVPGLFALGSDEGLSEADWPLLRAPLEEAIAQVVAMRESEGSAAAAVLAEHAGQVRAFARLARSETDAVVDRVRRRLHDRLQEICPAGPTAADQQAIERETVLYADRADITEELDRLDSHLAQFEDTIVQGGEAGKRLDFLAQEMLREVNTIASKASGTAIAAQSINAKLAVEKIKEQTANVE